MTSPDTEPGAPRAAAPEHFGDRSDFGRALTALRLGAGLTIRQLSRITGIPSATLGGYFTGRHLPPLSQPEQYAAMLTALGVEEADQDTWRQALIRLRKLPASRQGGLGRPFRGTIRYEITDADWFFGREQLTEDLIAEVEQLAAGAEDRFLAMVGASGSGKSSLLRAGVLARLNTAGNRCAVMQPGARPATELRATLAALSGEEEADPEPAGSPDGTEPSRTFRVLAVDQFEEVFDARVTDDERDRFIEALADLAADPAGPVVVVAVRADFYGNCVAHPVLLPLLSGRQRLIGPMDAASLRRALVEPARKAGVRVEEELIDLIISDVSPRHSGPGVLETAALPLFSHALLATWERASGDTLTVADYLATGGVSGAVQTTAEGVYTDLDPGQQRFVRGLFSQLVMVAGENQLLRRRIAHSDLEGADDDAAVEAIERLIGSRILTASEDSLEIAHEALLTAWPRLAAWVRESRDDLHLRQRISEAADAWTELGRSEDALLRGPLLELAAPFLDESDRHVEISPAQREFLERSSAAEEERRAAVRRGERRLRGLLVTALALTVLASVTAGILLRTLGTVADQRSEAQRQHLQALSRQLAGQADQLRATKPVVAAQLAVAAYSVDHTVEARSTLLESTGTAPASRLLGPPGVVKVATGPDGHLMATAGPTGVLGLWRLNADRAPESIGTVTVAGGGQLFAVGFNADGSLLAAGGVDGRAEVFDLADPAHPRRIATLGRGPGSVIEDLRFSADSRVLYLATGGDNGPALLRYRIDGARPVPLPVTTGFDGTVQGVAVTAAGRVATASTDGMVRLFEPRGNRLVRTSELFTGSATNYVWTVDFSPDGSLLAAGAKDKRVRVWNVAGPRPTLVTDRLTGFTSWVNSVTFSPDGTLLAAAASGNLTRVWRTGSWRPVASFPGPANLTSVRFLPSGRGLVTGAIDGTTDLWSLDGPSLPPFGDTVWSLSMPTTARRMYIGVGSADPHTYVADVSDREHVRLLGHLADPPASAGVYSGVSAVNPTDTLVVGGMADGSFAVWRHPERLNARPEVIRGATALIENVQFSPDGSYVGGTSDDGTAPVFTVAQDGTLTPGPVLKTGGLAFGLSFSPDDSLAAVTDSNNLVHLFSLPSGTEVATLKDFENYVYTAAFSPDGHTLAAAGADRTVRLWDVTDPTSPKPIGDPLRGPGDTVYNVAWNAAGTTLAAGSKDGNLWLWSYHDGQASLQARLGTLGGAAYQALADPGIDAFYSAGSGGTFDSWESDPATATTQLCARTGSTITPTEWALYAPGADYRAPCP